MPQGEGDEMDRLTGEYSYACDNHARADAQCHNCKLLLRYYRAGLSEGEARATRAIVADLRSEGERLDRERWPGEGDDHRYFADRYEAGEHLAAKAEGDK